jgi:asparagine synthase (glutamine-hydrolysing)
VLGRPKQGFEIPIDAWLRGPLRTMFEAAVFDPQARVRDLVNQAVARKVYDDHLRGWGRHGRILWGLLELARWAETYMGSGSPRAAAG